MSSELSLQGFSSLYENALLTQQVLQQPRENYAYLWKSIVTGSVNLEAQSNHTGPC